MRGANVPGLSPGGFWPQQKLSGEAARRTDIETSSVKSARRTLRRRQLDLEHAPLAATELRLLERHLDRSSEDALEALLLVPNGAVAPERRGALGADHGAAALAFGHGDGDDALRLVPGELRAPVLLGLGEVPVGVALELDVELAELGALPAGLLDDLRTGLRRRGGRHEARDLGDQISGDGEPLIRRVGGGRVTG